MSKNLIIDGQTLSGVTSLKAKDANTGLLVEFPDTSDATAIASDILQGKTAYANGSKLIGTNTGGGTSDIDGIIDGTLTTFALPAGRNTIAPYRFYDFQSLINANIAGCVTLGNYAFDSPSSNSSTTTLTLGAGLRTIGDYALRNRRAANIGGAIPVSVTSIGSYGCYYLGYNSATNNFSFNPSSRCSVGTYGLQYSRLTTLGGNFSTLNSNSCEYCNYLTLVDIDVNGTISSNAFRYDSALTSLHFKLVGSLGSYAFYQCYNVNDFEIDGESVITSLGDFAFSRFGSNRTIPANNILVMDFSNSSFTNIPQYCFGSDTSSTTYTNKYMSIIFPETLATINGAYAFRYSDHCDFYFNSPTPPALSVTTAWSNATNYTIFVPYTSVTAYRSATNWTTQATYMRGFAPKNTFAVGDTLPSLNWEGYEATWYSDKACTQQVTTVTDANAIYYCIVGTVKMGWEIKEVTAMDCNVVITDGIKTYQQGNAVLTGTQLTISGIPSTSGWVPYLFTVNGVDVKENLPYTLNVDSDVSIMAIYYNGQDVPVNPTLDLNDWSIISQISAAGTAANFWAVGDCKGVELNGTCGTLALNTTYYSYILGFNHNSDLEGTGISFGTFKTAAENGVSICLTDSRYDNSNSGANTFCMNTSQTNSGGWKDTQIRYSILGSVEVKNQQDATSAATTTPVANSLMSCLPASLRAVMKPITKWTNNVGANNTESAVTTTVDYLPLLAEYEIFGTRSYANQYEQNKQARYQYYTAGNSRIKYRQSATTTAAYWWERSARYSSYGFCLVSTGGNAYDGIAYTCYGVAPCFLI